MLATNKTALAHRFAPIALGLLLVILLMRVPSAQTICNIFVPTPNPPTSPTGNFFGSVGSINSLLGVSLIIMLVMATISGLLYMFGYSFRINNLVSLSKQEFGEIAITTVIVLVLVGTFSLTSALTATPLLAPSGAYSQGIFYSDCASMTNYAITLFDYSFDLGITQDFTKLVGGVTLKFQPADFGFSVSPFRGYSSVDNAIGELFILAGGMAGLLLAIGVLLGIFYSIMPLFLFAGIILRTMPWTRPAGGAFLGMFIGFFIVFPLLLHFIIANTPANLTPSQLGPLPQSGIAALIFNSLGNPGASFTLLSSILSIVDPTFAMTTILGVIVPSMYGIFAAIFSFIIAFDFAETAGDFLGAPSLSTAQSLNKLL